MGRKALSYRSQERGSFSGRDSNSSAISRGVSNTPGPLPPPPLFIRYLQRSAQSPARQSAHLPPTFFENRNSVRASAREAWQIRQMFGDLGERGSAVRIALSPPRSPPRSRSLWKIPKLPACLRVMFVLRGRRDSDSASNSRSILESLCREPRRCPLGAFCPRLESSKPITMNLSSRSFERTNRSR